MTEDELIDTLFAPLAGPGGLALKDDAAVIEPPTGEDLVVTADAIVAGVHFFADDPPATVAAKALGVNLSDLAAKAAVPVGFLLTLARDPATSSSWLEQFASGLGATAAAHGCPLLGGDTVRTPGPLTLSITAFGSVPRGGMLPRTGARPGDRLFVSGTIGDAALGLRLRQADRDHLGLSLSRHLGSRDRAFLVDRYRVPQPRLGLRAALRTYAHAGMDVSDGLVGDLRKMLRVSGVGASVDLAQVPVSAVVAAALAAIPASLETAMTGGDDYEILASVPAGAAHAFMRAAAEAGVRVTEIGCIHADPRVVSITHGAKPVTFAHESFQHF